MQLIRMQFSKLRRTRPENIPTIQQTPSTRSFGKLKEREEFVPSAAVSSNASKTSSVLLAPLQAATGQPKTILFKPVENLEGTEDKQKTLFSRFIQSATAKADTPPSRPVLTISGASKATHLAHASLICAQSDIPMFEPEQPSPQLQTPSVDSLESTLLPSESMASEKISTDSQIPQTKRTKLEITGC